MVIIYNPTNGSPIPKFNCDGNWYHKINKEEVALEVGEILQFPDNVGEFMVKNWGFLERVTPQRAQEIMAKPKEAAYKCEYCEFSTDHKVALAGHMRSHKAQLATASEPQVDPSIIPVAEATPAEARINTQEATKDIDDLTKGPDWYGEGLTETRGPL